MYVTKFVIDPNSYDVETINRALREIRIKDKTFKFVTKKLKDGKYLVKVFSETRDQAHKRGVWISKNVIVGAYYKVEEVR